MTHYETHPPGAGLLPYTPAYGTDPRWGAGGGAQSQWPSGPPPPPDPNSIAGGTPACAAAAAGHHPTAVAHPGQAPTAAAAAAAAAALQLQQQQRAHVGPPFGGPCENGYDSYPATPTDFSLPHPPTSALQSPPTYMLGGGGDGGFAGCVGPRGAAGGAAGSELDLLHSLAGDWIVSDPYPPDSSFSGLKVYADGTFFCSAGTIRSGAIQVTNAVVREVSLRDAIGGNVFVFSITPNGRHMAGRNIATSQLWHLEKLAKRAGGLHEGSQASSLSSANPTGAAQQPPQQRRGKARPDAAAHPGHRRRVTVDSILSSDRSSCSELTPRTLREIIHGVFKAGRRAGDSTTTVSSASCPYAGVDGATAAPGAAVPPPRHTPPPAAAAAAALSVENVARNSKQYAANPARQKSLRKPAVRPLKKPHELPQQQPPPPPPPQQHLGILPDADDDTSVVVYAAHTPASPPPAGVGGGVDAAATAAAVAAAAQQHSPPAHCRVFGEVKSRREGATEQQRQLSKDIVASRSAEEVLGRLEAFRTMGLDPNAVCLSSAAYKVARLNGLQDARRSQVLEYVIREVVTYGLRWWDAQALSKLLWACATAGYKSPELFGAAEDYVHHEGLTSFRAQHLAYAVWSFATSGHRQSSLFEKVDKEIVKRGLASFNSQDICMCLKGLAVAGHKTAASFRVAETEVAKRGADAFNAQEVVILLASFSAVGQRYPTVLKVLDEGACDLSGVPFQSIAGMCNSVGRLLSLEAPPAAAAAAAGAAGSSEAACPRFFSTVHDETRRRTEEGAEVLPQHATSVAWAFAKAGYLDSPVFALTEGLLANKSHGCLKGHSLAALANTAWAFSVCVDREAGVRAIGLVSAEVKSRGSVAFSGHETVTVLTALADHAEQLDDPVTACTVVAKSLTTKRLRHFRDSEFIAAFKILAAMGVRSDALLKKVLAELAKRSLRGCTPAQLATLAWVLAKWGSCEGVGVVSTELDRRPMRQFSPGDLSVLMWAFAVVGAAEASAARCYGEVLKRPSAAFSAGNLADVVFGAARCGLDAVPLLRRVQADVLAKGYPSFRTEASTVALLFFSVLSPQQRSGWQATQAWIALPQLSTPSKELTGTLQALGHEVAVQHTVGDFMYLVALPKARVVVEDHHEIRPKYFTTTSVAELTRMALQHEGWGLYSLDYMRVKKTRRASALKSGVEAASRETAAAAEGGSGSDHTDDDVSSLQELDRAARTGEDMLPPIEEDDEPGAFESQAA